MPEADGVSAAAAAGTAPPPSPAAPAPRPAAPPSVPLTPPLVVDAVLALMRAFQDDPIARYVLLPGADFPRALATFYAVLLRLQYRHDLSLCRVMPDGRGAALWQRDAGPGCGARRAGIGPAAQLRLAPHLGSITGWAPRSIVRILRLGDVVDAAHARVCGDTAHYYLGVLGVDPVCQGRGYALARGAGTPWPGARVRDGAAGARPGRRRRRGRAGVPGVVQGRQRPHLRAVRVPGRGGGGRVGGEAGRRGSRTRRAGRDAGRRRRRGCVGGAAPVDHAAGAAAGGRRGTHGLAMGVRWWVRERLWRAGWVFASGRPLRVAPNPRAKTRAQARWRKTSVLCSHPCRAMHV
jgi:hypothetical protein